MRLGISVGLTYSGYNPSDVGTACDEETPAEIQLWAALHTGVPGRLQPRQCVRVWFSQAQERRQELEAILRQRRIR
jgi:hypothetical protein